MDTLTAATQTPTDRSVHSNYSITYEEPWSEQIEEYLKEVRAHVQAKAEEHDRAGYKVKYKHNLIGTIALTTSTATFLVSTLLGCNAEFGSKLAVALVSAVNVFWTTVYTQLGYGDKFRAHFFFNEQYRALDTDIEQMLVRDKVFRIPADAALMEVRERLKKLYTEPEQPRSRCFLC